MELKIDKYKSVKSQEVYDHIDRTCPHGSNRSRNARLHAQIDCFKWIKVKISLSLIRSDPHSIRDVKKYSKLILNGSMPPAIVLSGAIDGNGELVVFSIQDGAHRVAAAKLAGLTFIDAYFGF